MKRGLELEVEGLRGLAALMVLYTHLLAPNHDVDPGYTPPPIFWTIESGQGAVLLFFVLSGYVIGLTNQQSFSIEVGRNYLWRRFVRLVPLCWLAITLSVLALPGDSGRAVLGNFLFLQNELPYGDQAFALLAANTNLWSLNYEVLYYLLFLVIWALPPALGLWPPLLCAAALLLCGVFVPGFPTIVTNYATGWLYWLAGLWLSTAPKAAEEARWPWPALLLFGLATWKVKPLFFLAKRFELLPPATGWVNYSFVDFIPVCLVLVMIAAQRAPRFAWVLTYAAAAIPTAFLVWRALRGRAFADDLALYDVLVVAGVALWWWRPTTSFFRWAAPVGAISYGIYIFQRPAQWFIAQADWLPRGNEMTFTLRVLVMLALTLGLAWIAERRLQPLIRRLLTARSKP